MEINPSMATVASSIYGTAIQPIDIRQVFVNQGGIKECPMTSVGYLLEIPAAAASGFNFIFSPFSLITSLNLTTSALGGDVEAAALLPRMPNPRPSSLRLRPPLPSRLCRRSRADPFVFQRAMT
ncbi:hypothetical protein KSP40_PGU001012 [Platanthera guangdongensis]|uniref:Uncharacterized protein n=1 Tax=Platanthera guangdongensis TaxID=2320717 RepID=A0ABR2LW71_9ASPA